MVTIHKYVLPMIDVARVKMPEQAKILSVANQRESLVVYVEVQTTNQKVTRQFSIAGTGHPIEPSNNARFVGTVMFDSGSLVLHVYDLGEKPADA